MEPVCRRCGHVRNNHTYDRTGSRTECGNCSCNQYIAAGVTETVPAEQCERKHVHEPHIYEHDGTYWCAGLKSPMFKYELSEVDGETYLLQLTGTGTYRSVLRFLDTASITLARQVRDMLNKDLEEQAKRG